MRADARRAPQGAGARGRQGRRRPLRFRDGGSFRADAPPAAPHRSHRTLCGGRAGVVAPRRDLSTPHPGALKCRRGGRGHQRRHGRTRRGAGLGDGAGRPGGDRGGGVNDARAWGVDARDQR